MKRGLITWDKTEIAAEVFAKRVAHVRSLLKKRRLPAALIYSDLWRSNHARYLSNFMPYFNRAFLVVPVEDTPTLFCGLSPRTYNWIRSVTTIELVRPAGNFADPLFQLAEERGWTALGVLDKEQLPSDLTNALKSGRVELVPIDGSELFVPVEDPTELALRRKAAALARQVLEEELGIAAGATDYVLAGKLERRSRRAGAEDLIVLVTNGSAPPGPPGGQTLGRNSSVSLALEYRGHWVRATRLAGTPEQVRLIKAAFERHLDELGRNPVGANHREGHLEEGLSGGYPYECREGDGICAIHIEVAAEGARQYYGDTCRRTPAGIEVL